MEISNFSSLVEVGVTLNIACVAVEYVKSYTSVLCNQVFSLGSLIKEAINDCRFKLNEVMDETTLENLPDNLTGGRSIVSLKRQLTKDRKELNDDIQTKEQSMQEKIGKVCEVKNISSICLWLFLYGLCGLFLIGIEQEDGNNSAHLFWSVLTLVGLLIIVVGWTSDGERRPWWKFGYCSLRFSLVSFVIAVLLSSMGMLLVSVSWVSGFIENCWDIILVISMLMLYSNFAVSSAEVWNKAKEGREHIQSEKNELMGRCSKWNEEAKDLQGALHTDERLNAQEENPES